MITYLTIVLPIIIIICAIGLGIIHYRIWKIQKELDKAMFEQIAKSIPPLPNLNPSDLTRYDDRVNEFLNKYKG